MPTHTKLTMLCHCIFGTCRTPIGTALKVGVREGSSGSSPRVPTGGLNLFSSRVSLGKLKWVLSHNCSRFLTAVDEYVVYRARSGFGADECVCVCVC